MWEVSGAYRQQYETQYIEPYELTGVVAGNRSQTPDRRQGVLCSSYWKHKDLLDSYFTRSKQNP